MLSVLIALILDTYSTLRKDILLDERIEERKSLASAFYLISNGGSEIKYPQWEELIKELRPNWKENQTRYIFNKIDQDQSGSLSLNEFFQICDALLLRFSKREVNNNSKTLKPPEKLVNLYYHRFF